MKNSRTSSSGPGDGTARRVLDRVDSPTDLKRLSGEELTDLARECRSVIINTITKTGGHLASNLGVVELTLALHRVFDSPKDRLV